MFFLDPERGGRRRQWVVGQIGDCLAATSRIMHTTGSDIADHFRSLTGRVRQIAGAAADSTSEKHIDSAALLDRIRTEIGEELPGAAGAQFMAESDGTVTVTGRIEASQIDYLLSALHRVPGVGNVINRIEVHQSPVAQEPAPATQQVGNL
jgi:osmotically-inducible protein OsmY